MHGKVNDIELLYCALQVKAIIFNVLILPTRRGKKVHILSFLSDAVCCRAADLFFDVPR